jgi:hypothetical protein
MCIACRLIVAVTIERKTQAEHVHREDDGSQCQCEIVLHDRYFDLIATASQAAPQPTATIEPNSATIIAVVGREISAAKVEIIPAIIPSTAAMMFHVLPLTAPPLEQETLGTREIIHTGPQYATLLIFGCLARAPSQECGRSLLTKFALAQLVAIPTNSYAP